MYKIILGEYKYKLSYRGDINLDYKLNFKVYTRRWGHYDNYSIARTITGWKVSHLSYNGNDEKDGSKYLLKSLDHDSVVYPEDGIKYALVTLWNMADEEEMSVEELQIKLQEIADWISEVEKVTGATQPSWCGYY